MIFVVAAPPAYVYNVSSARHRTSCTLVMCDADRNEIPHPDDEYLEGHLWVNSITGGPNEASHVPVVNFATTEVTPWGKREFAPGYPHVGKAQTKALGRTRHNPQKMLGH
jgi:hypothetical protein